MSDLPASVDDTHQLKKKKENMVKKSRTWNKEQNCYIFSGINSLQNYKQPLFRTNGPPHFGFLPTKVYGQDLHQTFQCFHGHADKVLKFLWIAVKKHMEMESLTIKLLCKTSHYIENQITYRSYWYRCSICLLSLWKMFFGCTQGLLICSCNNTSGIKYTKLLVEKKRGKLLYSYTYLQHSTPTNYINNNLYEKTHPWPLLAIPVDITCAGELTFFAIFFNPNSLILAQKKSYALNSTIVCRKWRLEEDGWSSSGRVRHCSLQWVVF